jgi:hypothetical protein
VDKKNILQRFAQVRWRNRNRSGENISPAHTTDTHVGLDAPRAALYAIQRKAQHTDESNPENAAVDEAKQDSKDALNAASTGMQTIIRKNLRKKVFQNEQESADQKSGDQHRFMQNQSEAPVSQQSADNTGGNIWNAPQRGKSMYQHSYNKAPSCYSTEKPKPVTSGMPSHREQTVRHIAARSARRQAAATTKAAARSAKGATKAASHSVKAVAKGASSLGKKLLAAMVVAWPVFLILLIVVILLVIFISPMGIFYSNNEDNPNQVSEMVPQIEDEWLDSLAATRRHYEDQGYTVTVNYGVASGDDGSRVNNWKDCLALYAVHKSGGEMATLVFDDTDSAAIHELFFNMNPVSVETRTETIESEVEQAVEKTKWIWNGKKFEQITYTETDIVVETEEVHYADIWVQNLRYVQMLDQYPLSEDEQGMVIFLLDYQHDPLWKELGISILSDDVYVGDISDLIKDLPPGQFGTAIVELALSRLGHPYSMDYRGQGNYTDCSGLTQWCYAQVNISLPWTAADQARWCAENGKVIDAAAAQPGDLIFYTSSSARVADRFMKIGHVGIYAGNGMMVDASSSKGCVVYRAVYGSPVMWARPS